MLIEAVNERSLNELLPLIRGYFEFYKATEIDEAKNYAFFSQFGESSEKGCVFSCRVHGQIVGFASVYFSYASSILSKVAIMNDLFVIEAFRRQGVATQLIAHCAKYAREKSAARLQWLTASTNNSAQALYDSLGARRSSWEFYTYETPDRANSD